MTVVANFKSYLQNMGYGKGTCRMLHDCVTDFLAHSGKEPRDTGPKEIESFHRYLQARPNKLRAGGLSERYIHHHLYALRTFFNWLEETGEIKENPISVMKFKRPERNTRQPLTQSEIKQLFESCRNQKETALLHLSYSCGLRRGEAVALDTRDIHFKQQVLYVRDGKGAKRRAVPMTRKVAGELEIHCPGAMGDKAFMTDQKGNRMSGKSLNRLLKKILERTEIKKETTLHHLRHSIATHLLESGLGIESVRDFLGHGHLETTQIYAKVHQYQLKKMNDGT